LDEGGFTPLNGRDALVVGTVASVLAVGTLVLVFLR
jgi:hypothetical protein